jgi:CubicO group peptidase (beta-lactamase class C family)
MRNFIAVLFVVSVSGGAVAAVSAKAVGFAAVNAAVGQAEKQAKVVSIAFAAAHDGAIVDTFADGMADKASKTKVDDATIFAIESCSKSITAMAAMKLVDAGKFALDTKVFEFLGLGTPKDAQTSAITVKELMNHSAGLPDELHSAASDDPTSMARGVLGLRKLAFAPGSQQKYSNVGFAVLGALIEKASGEDYHTYVEREVFGPAGITDARWENGAAPIAGQAVRYSAQGKPLANSITGSGTPGGGWILSASDGAKLLAAYDALKIVSKGSYDAMLAPPEKPLKPRKDGSAFGLGWDVVQRDGGRVFYGKNGGGNGAHAWLEHDFAGNDFAVFSSGGNGSAAHRPGLRAVEKALDQAV